MGLLTRAIFGTKPVSWMLRTILREVLRAFLAEIKAVVPLTIILMSPRGAWGARPPFLLPALIVGRPFLY